MAFLDNESELSAGEQSSPSEKQDCVQIEKLTTDEPSTVCVQRNGGPRTKQGKDISRLNALKYGIFSQAVVLKGEPRATFNFLLSGFRDDLKPEGTLEKLLVDKLAATVWRLRRLFILERERPLKGTGFADLGLGLGGAPSLDALLRCETNLERTFDRTLNQLERLQRIRKGLPAPPTLNVDLST